MKTGLLLISILSIFSCKTTVIKESKAVQLTSNEKWMQAINDNDMEALASLYTMNAIVVSNTGVLMENRAQIIEVASKGGFMVNEVTTTKRIKANAIYDYEIGNFKNKQNALVKHLIIWKTSDSTDLRELEFLSDANDFNVNLEEINDYRKKWMDLCNSNNAEALVATMYAEDAMYYSHRPIVLGRSAITSEYAYMNNPQYKLTLTPIIVEPVNENIVFELGQCSGSYPGKYMIVWKKSSEGTWQVLFDSNI